MTRVFVILKKLVVDVVNCGVRPLGGSDFLPKKIVPITEQQYN